MITVIEKAVWLYMFGNSDELHALKEAFQFPHPYRSKMDLYTLHQRTNGEKGWNGLVSPIKVYRDGRAEALRGFKDTILDKCVELGIELSDKSKLIDSPFSRITVDDIPGDLIESDFELDEGQRSIISEWLKHGMGIGKIAVNGGKTAAFAGFASYLKEQMDDARFLYVTDRERLTGQVDKEMKRFLPGWHITKYGGGGKDNTGKDMVVCTLAMIRTHLKELVSNGWLNSFNAVMFDESQHASSNQAENILMEIKGAFFRIGASDTVKDNDPIAKMKITGLVGPVRTVVHQSALIQAGRSAVPHIYVVDPGQPWSGKFEHIPYQPDPFSKAWVLFEGEHDMREATYVGPVFEHDDQGELIMRSKRVLDGVTFKKEDVPKQLPGLHLVYVDKVEYEVNSSFCLLCRSVDKSIVQFMGRNKLIVEWAKHFSDQGKRTLVIATRTMHVLLLETLLCNAVDEDLVIVATGESTTKQRNDAFERFKNTPGAILVSPLVKEGVSINEIEAGVVADYVGDAEFANQIVGRFIRKKKEGPNAAEIVWFVDRQQRRFERGCLRVLKKMYKEQGASYMFYWPLVHPCDLKTCDVYGTADDPVYSLDGRPAPRKFLSYLPS
jgi:superfamily II DNA or RNA helicase